MNANEAAVVIAGGGIVGLTLACLLAEERRLREAGIIVLEPREPQPPAAETGLRVSAISPRSQAILSDCGAWQGLPPERLGPYQRMCVWRDGGPGGAQRIRFDAAEQGLPVLGHIVENELLRWALWQRAADAGVGLRAGCELLNALIEPEQAAITTADGERLGARLLVAADGARSRLRQLAGLPWRYRSYRQRGLVTVVSSERWHEQCAWQRFLPGGPLALLPLADGRSSIVWSVPDAQADALLDGGPEALGEALTAASERVLGRLSVAGEAQAFPLAAGHAPAYVSERLALVGDAAHQVHPLAGQGVNLGLADAAALAGVLRAHAQLPAADPGDRRVLRRYERARKADNLLTLGTMDLFHRVFGGGPALAGAGGIGLAIADRVPALKRRLAAQALGSRGLVR
ncbi:MAG: 2-octaprenyl-3-methyl-6-methoxy-1,4-benzoquinol hydroxylase [Gammaproteobacteria bacterium]|nr:MAG: 2-octaprenyl-3-methyl-6-methoxy-1,4-benzoquinol hydroxylase [Gammaproteobacteria bacterium]